jgi:hypothetical protein
LIVFEARLPFSQRTNWTPLQSHLIKTLLGLLAPSTPFPPYTHEAANNLDQIIRCRQWLLHAGNALLDPNEGYNEAWLHVRDDEMGPVSYRTTPSWDLFHVLQAVASDSNLPWTSDEPSEKEDRVIKATKGEIFSALESTMAHFKVLFTRQQLFRKALELYDDIIEHDVL